MGQAVPFSNAGPAPGIFTTNSRGTGQGEIFDSANRLVDATNPATAGSSIVQIYCTGLGQVLFGNVAPAPASPLDTTITAPTVTIGGVAATAEFSGLTPGAVGLYQVNALVPAGASKGDAVPVVISIDGVSSNVVTMAVQ